VLALCDRFHALPSQVLAEDAGILRLLRLEQLGGREEEVSTAGG
jgi:hypothetical protein